MPKQLRFPQVTTSRNARAWRAAGAYAGRCRAMALPVLVTRNGESRTVLVAFDGLSGEMRCEYWPAGPAVGKEALALVRDQVPHLAAVRLVSSSQWHKATSEGREPKPAPRKRPASPASAPKLAAGKKLPAKRGKP